LWWRPVLLRLFPKPLVFTLQVDDVSDHLTESLFSYLGSTSAEQLVDYAKRRTLDFRDWVGWFGGVISPSVPRVPPLESCRVPPAQSAHCARASGKRLDAVESTPSTSIPEARSLQNIAVWLAFPPRTPIPGNDGSTIHVDCRYGYAYYIRMTNKRFREPFNFTWRIPECGFRFVTCPIGSERRVRCLIRAVEMTRYRTERTLDIHTGLFKQFANLEPTEPKIVSFANRYGLLGISEWVSHLGSGKQTTEGERLERWLTEIRTMRRLVNLWGLIQSESGELQKFFTFKDDRIHFDFENHGEAVVRQGHPAFEELRNDVMGTAWYLLGRSINEKLNAYHVTARLMRDRKVDREMTLFINPSSLVSALWLQFARAVEGNRQYRVCEFCNMPFEVGRSAGAKRTDAKFCSDSHRAAFAAPPKPRRKK